MSHLAECGENYCAEGCPEYPAIAAALKLHEKRTNPREYRSEVLNEPSVTERDHEQAERSGAITHYERQLERRVADLEAQLTEAQERRRQGLESHQYTLDMLKRTEAQLADEKDRNKARILREQRLKAQLAEAQEELERVAADPARAFSLRERGFAAAHSDSEESG